MFHRFRSIHLQRTEGSEIKPELTGARDSTQCNGEHRCEVWGWVVSSAPRQRAAADKDLLPSGFSELKVSETEELPPFPSSNFSSSWSCKRWRHFFFKLTNYRFWGALKWILNSFWLSPLTFSLWPDKCQSARSLWIQLQEVIKCSTNPAFRNRYSFSLSRGKRGWRRSEVPLAPSPGDADTPSPRDADMWSVSCCRDVLLPLFWQTSSKQIKI